MKLFNSLTKQLEDFQPIKPGEVTLYSCGPTVYNNLHIGNLSAFIYADLLRRTLMANGYNVKHVMNITDVDDKTIRDSATAYPDDDPKTALQKLTDRYTKVFMNDFAATGNSVGDVTFVSAVDTITEMITLTQRLLDAGMAYLADDGVYFSVADYQAAGYEYGLLQKVDVAAAKSRVANDEYDKDSASDFALWKKETTGEPAWPAEFTADGTTVKMDGRPGWHIECSAMSEKLLGVPLDIHTGGIDLKFPHHENEIAQTCGADADKLANYFVHNNHILVDGKKMSKSLGNFYTLRDVEDKGFSPQAFRLAVLEGHYQSESNFSWDILEAAQNRLKNWQTSFDTRWQIPFTDGKDTGAQQKLQNTNERILESLSDNLNTPQAIAEIESVVRLINNRGLSTDLLPMIKETIRIASETLGLHVANQDINNEQKDLLKQREQARADKDWAKSDEIRDQLIAQGIGINDSSSGQIWSRL